MYPEDGVPWVPEGVAVFGDCAINIEPSAEELSDIAIASADTAKKIAGIEPRVAMLSFSTKGSGNDAKFYDTVSKVQKATELAKAAAPDLALDGEFQFDAAIAPEVGELKAPGSKVAGHANTFIFPNINAGNIGYKIAQRLGGYAAYGPILQGLNAPIFILIFYQFFKTVPKALIEAAMIDGAGYFKSFFRVSLPSAAPAFITVALFSFVWYWNESYLTELYVHGVMSSSGLTTLIIQLQNFAGNYSAYATTAVSGATSLNESIKMAGTLLAVLPLLVLYFALQRHFVESIDRTGITGE